MTQNRCWLLAAFLFAVALAQYDTQPRRAIRGSAVPAVKWGSSTRAVAFGRGAQPRPFEAFALSPSLRDSMVALALAQVGVPYVFGGATPRRGFDCSGLVRYVVSQVHMTVPRTAMLQGRVGAAIDRPRLERGDLVTFGDAQQVSHIGIYIGDGRYVHASVTAGRVIISTLDGFPTVPIRRMRGARRLLATSDPFEHTGG